MRIKLLILIISIHLCMTGCYSEITGKVVDADTGKPIEGAVVLVEWTITKGLGHTSTESYKVIEAVSDKDGHVTISGNIANPLVNRPRMTVYKKGYVAWNNEYIFPNWGKRKDYKWSDGLIVKLEPFKKEFSRADHVYFLHSVTHWGKLIDEAYRWEEIEKERQK